MKLEYRMDSDGKCFTPCPNEKNCMINSYACSECKHYFGDSGGVVMCNGQNKNEK